MHKLICLSLSFIIFFSFIAEARLAHPVFFNEMMMENEFYRWNLSRDAINSLRRAELEADKGYVMWLSQSEIEGILKPEAHAFWPAFHRVLLGDEEVDALTINYPAVENGNPRVDLAVSNIENACISCNLDRNEVYEIVKFIENDFSSYLAQGLFYLSKDITGLAYDLEYDSNTNLYFIHLKQLIGSGMLKDVYRSVLYGIVHPQVVATAVSRNSAINESEIEVIKALQHIERVLHLITITESLVGEGMETRLITAYYDGGNLTDEYKKEFSLKEKISLAKDLLEALKDTHTAGYAHNDVHMGNVLLEKNSHPLLKDVRYRLVLADWGNAVKLTSQNEYVKKRDIYAAAVTLYGLFHENGFNGILYNMLHHHPDLFANSIHPSENSQELLLGEISRELVERLRELNNAAELDIKEQFERIILQMLHPSIVDFRDAAFWFEEIESLFFLS